MIQSFKQHTPQVAESAFVAPDAWVIGDVQLGPEASVFFGAVLRGDILPIRIGARTNIQEHAVLHTSNNRTPTIVGEDVTVGHRAIIHGCTVGNCSLIGMGAIILDGAVIAEECVIGAGTVILENIRIPPRSLVVGTPGKIVRELGDEDVVLLKNSAAAYVEKGSEYREIFSSR